MAVQCEECHSDVPDGARFCPSCGRPLAARCPACGAPAGTGRFCSSCGTPLAAATPSATNADAFSSTRVSERRVTSVLFADLVGFTPLSESRDPEEVRDLLSRYFDMARTVVERYGGEVEKFIGDAVMAVWGVPVAHEDDAERSVRAGLDLVAGVAALGRDVGAIDLALRVGIVTGEVAVTIGATGQGMVAGDAVNTAARIQAAAPSGQVWVDDGTRALTAAAVSYIDAGSHALKGKSEPVRLYAARAVVAAVGGVQRVDGLEAPFVGRDRELLLVKEIFHAASEDGRARLVAVAGVAGVGKSRLGWEFEKYVDGLSQTVRWHRGRALSYGEGVAFWAFAEMVRSRIDVADGDPISVVQEKLAAALDRWVPDAAERRWIGPPLAILLGLEERRPNAAGFTREDLFAAWTLFLERVGDDHECVVLVFEDMQYADPGLLDFIDHLVDTARFPLFVLTLARPELAERRAGWGAGRRATQIYLEPMGDRAMAELVDGLVEGLPNHARASLVDRAEGVPLYAVEMVRALIDRDIVVPHEGRYVLALGAASQVDMATTTAPASLHALIAARLDALSPAERQLVQDASVLGLSVSRRALTAVSNVPDLDNVLADLVRKEILVLHTDRFSPERGQYRFVQALVRAVAYDTVSKRDRKARHLAVAAHLAGEGDELAAVLAQHYLDAVSCAPADPDADELKRTARELLERAAARAETLGSPDEAIRHYATAMRLTPDRACFARLAEGAARACLSAGQPEAAIEWAEKSTATYDELRSPVDAGRVAARAGTGWCELGNMQRAADIMRPRYESLAEVPDADGSVLPLAEELARAYMFLGDPDAARTYAEHALRIAEARQEWRSVINLFSRIAVIWLTRGLPTSGMALLRAAVELARQRHLPGAAITPLVNIAAFSIARDLRVAIDTAREALTLAEQTGSRALIGISSANLCTALWLAGEWDEIPDKYAEHGLTNISGNPIDELLLRYCLRSVLLARGDPHAAEVGLDTAPDADIAIHYQSYQQLAAAGVAAATGRYDDEAQLTAAAAQEMYDNFGLDEDFGLAWPWALESALAVGDLPEAERLLRLVAEARSGLVTPYVHAHLLRLRALVHDAAGDRDQVDADLAAAAEEFRSFGAPFFLARVTLERVERLIGAGGSAEVSALLDEAREIFRRLGAAPWLRRAEEVGARLLGAVS